MGTHGECWAPGAKLIGGVAASLVYSQEVIIYSTGQAARVERGDRLNFLIRFPPDDRTLACCAGITSLLLPRSTDRRHFLALDVEQLAR